jgi:diguanylate cyclase (GGDEF)-like protein/PAS domain S-box-containing protein
VADLATPAAAPDQKALRAEITRLNKVVKALMDRAERSTCSQGSDFSLFQATVLLEEQVRSRTAELEQALRENERIERALRKSEAKFRAVVSQSLVGIAIIEGGKFGYVNSKLAEIFGYAPKEMLELGPLDIAADPDREFVAHQIQRRLSGEADYLEYVFRGMRKDRSEIHVECHSSVMDVAGQPVLTSLIVDVTERIRALRKLEELQEQLREQAIHDPLTGLYNRLPLNEFLDRELSLASRKGYPVTVILADLDHFKVINDTYGHPAGDEVLRQFAERIKKHFRASDICCRYGGEEFLLVLPKSTNKEALKRASEIREIVARNAFVLSGSVINVTASFGVASYPQHGHTRDVLVTAADKALYKAKNDGRNRVEAFTEVT